MCALMRLPSQQSAAEGPPSCSPHCYRPGRCDGAHARFSAGMRRRQVRCSVLAAHHVPRHNTEPASRDRHAHALATLAPAVGETWPGRSSTSTTCGWQQFPLDRRKHRYAGTVRRTRSSIARSGKDDGDFVMDPNQQQQQQERQQHHQDQQSPRAAESAPLEPDGDMPHSAAPSSGKVRILSWPCCLTAAYGASCGHSCTTAAHRRRS